MNKIISTIEINSGTIRFVQAEMDAEQAKIINSEEVIYDTKENLTSGLKKLNSKYNISGSLLVTALPRAQVFLKKITVPSGNAQEVKNIVKYEAERYLPFPVETGIIDFYPLKPLSETSPNEVLLIAAKKETIDKYLENFTSAGFYPDQISVTTLAIINLLADVKKEEQIFAFLNFNDNFWEIAIFSQNMLTISRGFSSLDNIENEITNSLSMLNEKVNTIYYVQSKENDNIIKELKNTLHITVSGLAFNMLTGLLLPSPYIINLLPENLKEKILKKRTRKLQLKAIKTAFYILSAILVIFFAFTYYKSSSNREIIRKIESNRKEIIELSRLDEKLETISNYKKNNTLPLEILKEVSQNLPSNVYLRQFNYDNVLNTVIVRARASSYDVASKTAAYFGKSKYFAQVTNKGSYTARVGDKDFVDFELQLQLKSR
ncbi:MAG: hypothetical protein A3J83_08810 [Elusimicrobia bacterium RIFOXYA2_FULL_40_6]|nr:MAG: hypothetical protein A3J83_08810 [Elusimicrobia bacterium RIFOXYA2_FULL_40_6]